MYQKRGYLSTFMKETFFNPITYTANNYEKHASDRTSIPEEIAIDKRRWLFCG